MTKAIMIMALAAMACAQLCAASWGANNGFALGGSSIVGPPFGIQSVPSLASNGTNVFVAWQDLNDPSQLFRHIGRGALLGADGGISTPGGVILDSRGLNISPKVFSNGQDYLVVWASDGIHVRRVRSKPAS